ncbi:hypothetical protein ACFQ2B_31100 [Streptomyces stramineus]
MTPNLIGSPTGAVEFFPATRAEDPFRFKVTAVDHDGRIVEFRTPLQFVPETRSTGSALAQVVAGYNRLSPLPTATDAPADPPERTRADLQGQSVALAPATKPDDTRLDVATLVWGVAAPRGWRSRARRGPARPTSSPSSAGPPPPCPRPERSAATPGPSPSVTPSGTRNRASARWRARAARPTRARSSSTCSSR